MAATNSLPSEITLNQRRWIFMKELVTAATTFSGSSFHIWQSVSQSFIGAKNKSERSQRATNATQLSKVIRPRASKKLWQWRASDVSEHNTILLIKHFISSNAVQQVTNQIINKLTHPIMCKTSTKQQIFSRRQWQTLSKQLIVNA